ncbi:hypothetical protein SAMN05421791_103224 [Facklamia miroungae]|uniref:Uncharacterized protein n=1 Tax=Facklamia miroungae TaxID=120956 RepID=A0A1G7RY77_9LACT|nr:GNAT family N-acetyltransferase [Facklamia miroungae]SDG15728.1 hypothetical protein SAMN05421791_103224 [Facklamia miroungae]
MTEACKAMVNYMFELGYRKILIKSVIENISSNIVIEKIDFSFLKKRKFI